jgi:formyl-CoA transferase
VTPLDGIRVLDVATLYPAPLLAAMLGDAGADVVKVEPPTGDPLRAIGGDVPWSIVGRNKRSVVIDFDSGAGLETLHELIAAADVVVFNQPASVLTRWRCTDDQIAVRSSRAIVVHVSAFGSSGPLADRPGNGTLAEAFVGIEATSTPLGDTIGAMNGLTAVLLALYARDTGDGRGRVVDVSLFESLLPLLGPRLAGLSTVRSVRDVFAAADGQRVAISATTDAQLRRLTELTGGDVTAWIAARSAADALRLLVDARVPAIEANDIDALRMHPHVIARESIPPTGSAPAVGEHTDEVLREWLHGGNP